MFLLLPGQEHSITDAIYKSLNVLDIDESEEVEFVDGTEAAGDTISGTLRLTSAALDKEVADKIIAELKLPASSLIRIEIKPSIKVTDVEEDKDSGNWRLTDSDIINYTIGDWSENLCVLSKPNAGCEERYDATEWERHSLAAPFVCAVIIGYLNKWLHDNTLLPLVNAFLGYHNYDMDAVVSTIKEVQELIANKIPLRTKRYAKGINLSRLKASGVDFSDADLRETKLFRADLSGAILIGADLRGALIYDANLQGVDLRDADLRGADLSEAKLIGVDLSGADLGNANLSRADLRDADLKGTRLKGARLHGVNLRMTTLIGAKLEGATLSDADLRGANLNGADLSGANLQDANLRGADLCGAKIGGANFIGVDLCGVKLSSSSITQINGLRWPVVIVDGYMTIGCENHEISKWEQFTDVEIAEMHEDAAAFWHENKDWLLKTAKVNKA